MFPSSYHEFKAEPVQHYNDPYFPSHPVGNAVNPVMSAAAATVNEDAGGHYATYQHNGGYYASQPSPQTTQHNTYYGPGPGPVDGGGGGAVNNGNTYYGAGGQQNFNYYPPQQHSPSGNQQCNQYDFGAPPQQQYYGNGSWPGTPPPPASQPSGASPSYFKSEHFEMKPSTPPLQQQQSGAMPYYNNGGGHAHSPHSPHLMPGMYAHEQNWGSPPPPSSGRSPAVKPPSNVKRPAAKITDTFKAAKKPRPSAGGGAKRANNRFNGMSEEEVAKRGLPDYLRHGLDIVFIGINPSMFAAYTGKYYDGPGNHFWQALYLSGILKEPMSAVDDHKLLDHGIGFTNIVARTTRGLSDLSRKEIADGAEILREKLATFKPKIAVFNGKAIYEVYSGQKKFMFGRQPEPLNEGATWLWVMPSSSARCAQLPRAVDKVPFFEALRKFRDYLTGKLATIEDCDVVFANVSLRNWSNSSAASKMIKTDQDKHDHLEEINPNLQPYTDGVPANVPPSVTEVIEDVIRQHANQPASTSSSPTASS